MASLVLELGLIVGIAAVLALIGRLIKQPPLIAYLLTGLIIGPLFLNLLTSAELVESLAHIGVALFLFIVGLELDFRVLKDIGKVAAIAGIGQVIITFTLGFIVSSLLGFDAISTLYIATALAFSSTAVISLFAKNELNIETLHGKIAIGILIFQDLIAAFLLIILPVIGTGEPFLLADVMLQMWKGLIAIIAVLLLSVFVVSAFLKIAVKNQEILFLFSLGWALLVAIFFDYLGLTLEVGALIAGMALASSKYSIEMTSKMKGIRDFFVLMFFVFFGSLVTGPITTSLIINAVILSAVVLIGNPIIVMTLMKFTGYKKKTNFYTGLTIAQISEFSLILLFIGFGMGAVTQEVLSLIILTGLITFAISSYSLHHLEKIYRLFEPFLGMFDNKNSEIGQPLKGETYDIILFGYNRIGYNLVKAFNKTNKKFLIVDFNPKTIKNLTEKKIPCVYGDANDLALLEELKLSQASMVISTIPYYDTNMQILQFLEDKKVPFIPTAHSIDDAKKLYNLGAPYVIMPHFLGGEYMQNLLLNTNFDKKAIKKKGDEHRHDLFERMKLGHDHPKKDYHGL